MGTPPIASLAADGVPTCEDVGIVGVLLSDQGSGLFKGASDNLRNAHEV